MEPVLQLIVAAGIAVALMAALWWVARRVDNAGVVDVGWSAGVGLLAIFFAATSGGDPRRRMLVALLLGLWSMRLAIYLFCNRVWNKPEDRRYVAMRSHWGPKAWRNLFWFFEAQAVLAWLFALPALVIGWLELPPDRTCDLLGVAVWFVAIVGEAVADFQLAAFRADPLNRGKACRRGLWHYSRHPNYFFEFVHWWAYVLLGWGAGFWWVAFGLPWLLLWFLFRVTGIQPTEAQAAKHRGEDYRHYQRTTSAFIPWPPKKA